MKRKILTLIAGVVFAATCLFPISASANTDIPAYKNIASFTSEDFTDQTKWSLAKSKAKKTLVKTEKSTKGFVSYSKEMMNRTVTIDGLDYKFILTRKGNAAKRLVIKETTRKKGNRTVMKMLYSDLDRNCNVSLRYPGRILGYERGLPKVETETETSKTTTTVKANPKVEIESRTVKTTYTTPGLFVTRYSTPDVKDKRINAVNGFKVIKTTTDVTQKNGKKKTVTRVRKTLYKTVISYWKL